MTDKKYDMTFHYFRAFAILSVMLTHLWHEPAFLEGFEMEKRLVTALSDTFFHSSTIYFIFISGYLFEYVNRKKPFSVLAFYKAKIRNVLTPYLIISCLLLLVGSCIFWFGGTFPAFINEGMPLTSAEDVLTCLLYGTASLTPYWYIPFILSVFVISPLFFYMEDALLARILVPLSVLPLMVPRGLLFFFRNYCYFLPVFLLGIFFARNREMCMDFIIRHIRSIVHIAVFSTLLVFINFYLDFIPNTETTYFIQKTTIGMCAILLLERKQTPSPLLDLLARYSFPLFFLHVIVQNICDPVLFTGLLGLWGSLVPVSLLVAFVEMGLCVGLVFLLKKGLGKRSRYVIGG